MFLWFTVIHSGEYYLFESDSEDEEDLTSEDKKLKEQSASQVRNMNNLRSLFNEFSLYTVRHLQLLHKKVYLS